MDSLMWCGRVRRGVDSGSRHRLDGVGRKKSPAFRRGGTGIRRGPMNSRPSSATTDVGARFAQPSHTVMAISAARSVLDRAPVIRLLLVV
jgi:hypothetical protein